MKGEKYDPSNPDDYKECIKRISDWINGDCWGVVVNDEILFNLYNPLRTFREKMDDRRIKNELAQDLHQSLLCEINRLGVVTSIDIYMYPKERSPLKINVFYRNGSETYTGRSRYTTNFYASYIEDRSVTIWGEKEEEEK